MRRVLAYTGLLGGALVNLSLGMKWIDIVLGRTITIWEPNKIVAVGEMIGFFWLGIAAFIAFFQVLDNAR